jgi:hypothetical protein
MAQGVFVYRHTLEKAMRAVEEVKRQWESTSVDGNIGVAHLSVRTYVSGDVSGLGIENLAETRRVNICGRSNGDTLFVNFGHPRKDFDLATGSSLDSVQAFEFEERELNILGELVVQYFSAPEGAPFNPQRKQRQR